MAEVDFSDFDSVAEWFNKQSVDVRTALASRSSLRILGNVGLEKDDAFERPALACLHAILIAAAYVKGGTEIKVRQESAIAAATEIRVFARPFYDTVKAVFDRRNTPKLEIAPPKGQGLSTGVAATFAEQVVSYVVGDPAAFTTILEFGLADGDDILYITAFLKDAQAASKKDENVSNQVLSEPLWLGIDVPEHAQKSHDRFLEQLVSDPKWGFWHDWYQAMWDGNFDNWELAFEVTEIPDQIWKEGADAVAHEIENLRATLFFKKSPQVEDIFETSDGLYDVRSSIVNLSTLIDSVLKRIKFSYDMAIQSNHCDLSSMNVAAQAIRHVLENCRDDPNALEQYLRNARSLIQRGIDDNQLAVSDELTMLIATLDETTLQLRADHPEIAAAVQARTKQRLREIDDSKRIAIASNMDAMRDVTALRLNEEYRLDAAITRDGSDADAMSEAIQRSGHRAGKINLAEQAKKAEGSGVMSGLKISLRAKTLYDAALELMAGLPM